MTFLHVVKSVVDVLLGQALRADKRRHFYDFSSCCNSVGRCSKCYKKGILVEKKTDPRRSMQAM